MKLGLCLAVALLLGGQAAEADSLKNLLGGGNLGDVLTGLTGDKSLEVEDLAGTWKTTGPAVMLRSGNALEKAGGVALSTAAESKLRPYYDRLGVDNTVITIDKSGNYSMTIKGLPVRGRIIKNSDGATFTLTFTPSGKVRKFNSLTAYVQKSGNSMAIAVDMSKLLPILSKVASAADLSMISTAVKLLESYDNVCIGFRMQQ